MTRSTYVTDEIVGHIACMRKIPRKIKDFCWQMWSYKNT